MAFRSRFSDAIADDLSLPQAVEVAHAVARAADLPPAQRRALLLDFDRVLGLDLGRTPRPAPDLPPGAAALLAQREEARARRDYATSDALRDELAALGVEVRDTPDGQVTTARRP